MLINALVFALKKCCGYANSWFLSSYTRRSSKEGKVGKLLQFPVDLRNFWSPTPNGTGSYGRRQEGVVRQNFDESHA